MFALVESQTSLKMGHVGSKTRSLVQILEKTGLSWNIFHDSQNFFVMKFWTR